MLDFYRTRAGRTYFESTLPRIAKALERIADSLEKEITENSQENLYNNRNEGGE